MKILKNRYSKMGLLVLLISALTALALWAYAQPGFLLDLANKYVFC